jgi:hypothetical protein
LKMPPVLAAFSAQLSQIGFERTRRAVAALSLSVFVTLYFLVSLNAPDGFGRVFLALSLCYGVAFVGVAGEFFWGRWFATGLAWSGIMLAIAVLVMMGWHPQMAIFGGMHLIVALTLAGKKMATRYDGQEAWRTKYKMDDFGVARLQKTVTRAAASLPSLIIWALAPKEEGMATILALGALAFGAVGLRGLIRVRSWGVLALAGAGVLVAVSGKVGAVHLHGFSANCLAASNLLTIAGPTLAFVLMAAAVLPFAGAVVRYLRKPA